MSDELPRQAIREAKAILKTHVGRSNPITSQELSTRLGGLDTLDSTPNTRRVIREIIEEYQIPVVGCSDGYFVAETTEEYHNAQERLTSRVDGIAERKALLAEAWARSERPDPQAALGAFRDVVEADVE